MYITDNSTDVVDADLDGFSQLLIYNAFMSFFIEICTHPFQYCMSSPRIDLQPLMSIAYSIVANGALLCYVVDKTSVGDRFMADDVVIKIVAGSTSSWLTSGMKYTRYKHTAIGIVGSFDMDIGGVLWEGAAPPFTWSSLPGIILLACSCKFMQSYILYRFKQVVVSKVNSVTAKDTKQATAFMSRWKTVFTDNYNDIMEGKKCFIDHGSKTILDAFTLDIIPPSTVSYRVNPSPTLQVYTHTYSISKRSCRYIGSML